MTVSINNITHHHIIVKGVIDGKHFSITGRMEGIHFDVTSYGIIADEPIDRLMTDVEEQAVVKAINEYL